MTVTCGLVTCVGTLVVVEVSLYALHLCVRYFSINVTCGLVIFV
jgi:hypothetical protein